MLDFYMQEDVFVLEMWVHSNISNLNFSDAAHLYFSIPLAQDLEKTCCLGKQADPQSSAVPTSFGNFCDAPQFLISFDKRVLLCQSHRLNNDPSAKELQMALPCLH